MSLVLPADAVEIVSGTPTRTERALANGARNISWVCLGCHSRLWTQRDGAATLNLRAGTLDDTSGLRPVAQFWTSSAQPWAVLRENVLSYAEQPSDFGPLLAAWREREADQGPRVDLERAGKQRHELVGQAEPVRVVVDQRSGLRNVRRDGPPFGGQMRADVEAGAGHDVGQLLLARQRPAPDRVGEQARPSGSRRRPRHAGDRQMVGVWIVLPGGEQGPRVAGAGVRDDAGDRRLEIWPAVRRVGVAQLEKSESAAGQAECRDGLARLRLAQRPSAGRPDRRASRDANRCRRSAPSTAISRPRAQASAIRPPQPQLSSSACGASTRTGSPPVIVS